ncbi:MAG: cytochrome c maturation protein CcmE [Nitrospinota bacterium]
MRHKRVKLLIGGLVIAATFLYLGISGFQGNFVYFLTVDELVAQAPQWAGQGLRISGKVAEGSLRRNKATMELSFRLRGEKGELPVYFRGVAPDLIGRDGVNVIAEGKVGEDGVFQATNLMVACPSKFEEMVKEGKEVPKDYDRLVRRSQEKKAEPAN